MSWLGDIWTRIKAAIEGEKATVEATLTATEQKYLPAFGAWCKKLETTLETQGIQILEQGAEEIAQAFLNGDDVGEAISELVPKVIQQVRTDLSADVASIEADARNVAYTAIGLAIAALPTPATEPTAEKAAG